MSLTTPVLSREMVSSFPGMLSTSSSDNWQLGTLNGGGHKRCPHPRGTNEPITPRSQKAASWFDAPIPVTQAFAMEYGNLDMGETAAQNKNPEFGSRSSPGD